MSDDHGCKLRDLLPAKFDRMDEVVAEGLKGDGGGGQPGFPAAVLRMAGDRAAEAVKEALDCDVFEVLARAWTKAGELHAYTDEAKYPPGTRSSVFLGDHEVAVEVHPVLDVTVGPCGPAKIRFTLEVKAKFRSAELSILDGRIVAIGAGDCAASAQLKLEGWNLHDALEAKDLRVASPISLPAPGLAIL